MFCGLFSSFDPSSGSLFPSKMFFSFFCLAFLPWKVFGRSLGAEAFKGELVSLVWEFTSQASNKPKKVFFFIFPLFFLILSQNLVGLFPFSFAVTSNLAFNLCLAMSLWTTGVFYFGTTFLGGLISHFLPSGAPYHIWPLLVVVETVSFLIRPFTLAIRLMANVFSGHILLSLMGEFLFPLSGSVSTPFIAFMDGFEMVVSTVQAFVFMSLTFMYWEESSSH